MNQVLMRIQTKHFGTQEIDEGKVLEFPEGLPGFEDLHRWALLAATPGPILWLQALDSVDACLPVVEAFGLFPDYEVSLNVQDTALLQLNDPNEGMVFVVLTIRGQPLQVTANLLAPIVVNPKRKVAKQVILEGSPYSTRHVLPTHGGS
ncbi:MAG: flagellar assembly protein FliW [Armatimonadota bacterium]|nr:flagellar assembly protein FliW [Armatimonadota bacterium]